MPSVTRAASALSSSRGIGTKLGPLGDEGLVRLFMGGEVSDCCELGEFRTTGKL